ncbi:MAG: 4-hydroxy-tetrahydrodipicolinate synthase [Clostridia bacterium]|nr:4-hydroxy-tetrahydrodipicolinate synthase [Clostridia bacterium]
MALVTPMDEDGGIDRVGLVRLMNHVSPWVDGYVVMGTTGEPATLGKTEQDKAIREVIDLAGGKTVLAGVGGNDTASTCRRVEEVARLGADGALAVVPYYTRPPIRGIVAHYREVARVGLPVMAYNVPSRTGVDVSPAWAEIAAIEGVVGIKQAGPDLAVLQTMTPLGKVWCGEDDLVVPYRALGVVGVVSAAANVYPEEMRRLAYAPLEEAGRLQVALYPTLRALYRETNPIGIKAALAKLGICGATVRLPLMQ